MSTNQTNASQVALVFDDRDDAKHPFGAYLIEMMKTEGLMSINPVTIRQCRTQKLHQWSTVVLAPMSGHDDDVDMWVDFVRAGGRLFAIKPFAALADRLGLFIQKSVCEGYWKPDKEIFSIPLLGERALQFHGHADIYERPADASVWATWGEASDTADAHPAVFRFKIGTGTVVVMAFDPSRSVVLTRQGNPNWKDSEGDGYPRIRTDDLFARLDGQKWNDPALDALPQADILQRMVARLIQMLHDEPMPRVWYMPNGAKTVVCIPADSDGASGETISNQMLAVSNNGGQMSTYMIDHSIEHTDPLTVEAWCKAGHEAAIHPNYQTVGDANHPNAEDMDKVIKNAVCKFKKKYGFAPVTVRNHAATWVGWVEQAKIERSYGLRLDSAHAHRSIMGTDRWGANPAGYLSGTGMPQKFADERGEVLDIYQQTVHMADETLRTYTQTEDGMIESSAYEQADEWAQRRDDVIMKGLSPAQAFEAIRTMVQDSLYAHHSYLAFHFHPITFHITEKSRIWLRDFVLPYLKRHHVPIMSALHILDFMDAKQSIRIEPFGWQNQEFSFTIRTVGMREDLVAYVPAQTEHGIIRKMSVTMGEQTKDVPFWMDGLWNQSVAFFKIWPTDGVYKVRYDRPV